MIEKQIQELSDEIKELRELLQAVKADLSYYRDPDPALPEAESECEAKPDADLQEPNRTEPDADLQEPNRTEPDTVTREDLSKLFLSAISERKTTQKALLDLLAEYGVKSVRKLPDEKLGEIYERVMEMGK